MKSMGRVLVAASIGIVMCVISWGVDVSTAFYNAMFFANIVPIMMAALVDPPSRLIMYLATFMQWTLFAYLILWIISAVRRYHRRPDDV